MIIGPSTINALDLMNLTLFRTNTGEIRIKEAEGLISYQNADDPTKNQFGGIVKLASVPWSSNITTLVATLFAEIEREAAIATKIFPGIVEKTEESSATPIFFGS